MAYKPRRQQRYEMLVYAGFAKWEARALSRVAFTVPYMKPMIAKRNEEYERAIKRAVRQGLSDREFNQQWSRHIKLRYIARGWRRRRERWSYTVAFRMLKGEEGRYKAKHPEYESPWTRRQKRWRDFIAKVDQEYEKYPMGRAYPRKARGGVR